MSKKNERGLGWLLECAALLLDESAEAIKIGHTVDGKWPCRDEWEVGAKRDFDARRKTAKRLRKALKDRQSNPLGSPAKIFDVIADRIRAGDKVKKVLADYGIKNKR